MASSTDLGIQIGDPLMSPQLLRAIPIRNQIIGTDNPDILNGTAGDDDIFAKAGDDYIFGTIGNDMIDGGAGIDTVDYSNVAAPITLLPQGDFTAGSNLGVLKSIETIIGAAGQRNKIDSSKATGTASLDVNLAVNRLTVNNIPGLPPLVFTVQNFVDVEGTKNADLIVGDGADNTLVGGGGNDTLRGGGGADTLTGTNATARGVGEQDILTGGAGTDRFTLGDSLGSYYKGNGASDFARITDFGSGEQIKLGVKESYRIQRNISGFNLFTTTGGIQDLIAQVQFSRPPIAVSSGGALNAMSSADALAADPLTSAFGTIPEGDFTIASGQTFGGFVGV